MNRILIIAAIALMPACATTDWHAKDGKQASQQTIDECQYEASKATASATDANPMATPYGGVHALLTNSVLRRQTIMAQCMKVRGFE